VYASANDAFDNIYIPDEEHKNTLAELEKAGLITFTEPRAEFDKFIAGLQLENAHPDFKESKSYKATRPLTEEEKRRLKSEEYQLTDQGKKAYALIIEGVKQSLNKSADPTATP
jgi:vacuolar-type H+-ATPase subunit I/STV1